MLLFASTAAQLVATAQPCADTVPSQIVAQPPRMPFSLVDAVEIFPWPPRSVGGTKNATPPGLWVMTPNDRLAPLRLLLFNWTMAAPWSINVELKLCELVTPAFGLRNRTERLIVPCPAFSPPSVRAELVLMMLFAGEFGWVKSSVSMPFFTSVGPVYVFEPDNVSEPKCSLDNPPFVPLFAITPS